MEYYTYTIAQLTSKVKLSASGLTARIAAKYAGKKTRLARAVPKSWRIIRGKERKYFIEIPVGFDFEGKDMHVGNKKYNSRIAIDSKMSCRVHAEDSFDDLF